MLDMTYDENIIDDPYGEDWDEDAFESLAESWDDEDSSEFFGAFLPGPLKVLDPLGAALGAATGLGKGKSSAGKRPATATGRPYYSAPALKNYVTQAQLKSSLAKVTADVRKNAAGIKTVNGKADSNRSRLNQQNAINVKQGRQIRSIKKEFDQQAQTQMLVSLLSRTEEARVVSDSSGSLPAGTTLRLDKEIDPLMFLLPALTGSGQGGSGMNNPLLLLALLR